MAGQINLGTSAGNLIKKLSERPDVNTIVEIGTWNGLGSTICVLSGIKKTKKKFISIELYQEMHDVAKLNLTKHLSEINLICGTIINVADLEWFDHSIIDAMLKKDELCIDGIHIPHAKEWFNKDVETIRHAPNVEHLLPDEIDFLILDGGEYSTYPEWIKLKSRTKILFIDDTTLLKGAKIRSEVIASREYKTIMDDQKDRYGYSVFERY